MRARTRLPVSLVLLALGLAPPLAARVRQDAPRAALDHCGDPLPSGAVARLGSLRLLHRAPLAAAAYLDDEGLVSLSAGGELCVWERASGAARARHALARVAAASFAAGRVALALVEGGVEVWDARRGERVARVDASAALVSLAPGGARVALGAERAVVVYDVASGAELARLATSYPARALAWSTDGGLLAAAGVNRDKGLRRGGSEDQPDSELRVWAIQSERPALTVDVRDDALLCIAFAASDGLLYAAGTAARVRAFDVETGAQRAASAAGGAPVRALAVAPTRERGASGALRVAAGDERGRVRVLASDDLRELVAFSSGQLPVCALELAPDGEHVLVGAGASLALWGADGAERLVGARHETALSCLDVARDGRLATGGLDGSVRLWSASGAPLALARGHAGWVFAVRFAAAGERLVSAGQDGTLRVWSSVDGRALAVCSGHRAAVTDVDVSPDGRLVASASADKSLRLWRASDGELVRAREGLPGVAPRVRFAPDGATLVWAGADVRVLAVEDLVERARFAEQRGLVTAMDLASDGRTVALGLADGSVRAVGLDDGRMRFVLRGHPGRVSAVAFDPSGRRLASASYGSGDVRLFDAASGRELATLAGYQADALCIAFARDGCRVAAGGLDGTALVWALE